MATIGTITGSKFIGCPIIVPVKSANINTAATFHRIRLRVTVTGNGEGEFEFSSPCESKQTINFDVSSALRAVAEKYEYTATGINPVRITEGGSTAMTYPSWKMSLYACDDYMLDGMAKEGMSPAVKEVTDSYYRGRLTDRERLTDTTPGKWSRKPTSSPEIVFVGMKYLSASAMAGMPSDAEITITAKRPQIGDPAPWPIAATADAFEMRFINSLGIHDSVHVTCLRTSEVALQTDKYVIARQETLDKFSRTVAVKKNNRETWKMSSGPLDSQWHKWYLHEFLMAEIVWIKVDGAWLPCNILTEETVSGIDRQKASQLEVQFTIEFDLDGSPFA